MFSVILYIAIGCLLFTGPTVAMNDTRALPEEVKSNVSSRVIPDCIKLDNVKDETTEIVRLIQSAKVNIVDITIISRDTKGRYEVLLVNHIGRKILSWFELGRVPLMYRLRGFDSTLNAGRRNFEFYLNETRKGCIESELNGIDSVTKILLNDVASNMKASKYEVEVETCYLPPNITSKCRDYLPDDTCNMKCCKMNGCYFITNMEYIWLCLLNGILFNIPYSLTSSLFDRYIRRLNKSEQRQKSCDRIFCKLKLYYILTDSRMSIWYRLVDLNHLIYLKRGRVITNFIRELIYVCIIVGMLPYDTAKFTFFEIIVTLSGVFFIITKCTYLRDDYTVKPPWFFKVIAYPSIFVFVSFSNVVFQGLVSGALFIFMGICYNILYYSPLVTFFSMFLYYSWRLWKSTMEVRQYNLQMLIHKALEEWRKDNGHADPKKENNKVVLVLSKDFYNKIERELLPFKKCIICFLIKVAILFLVLFSILYYVIFLFQSDVNSDAQVLTAICVAALTFLLNIIIPGENKKLDKALKEEMESNVTRMVDRYARHCECNQELIKTFLPVSFLVDEIYLHPVVDEIDLYPLAEIVQHETSL